MILPAILQIFLNLILATSFLLMPSIALASVAPIVVDSNTRVADEEKTAFDSLGAQLVDLLKTHKYEIINDTRDKDAGKIWFDEHFKDSINAQKQVFKKTEFSVRGSQYLSPTSLLKSINRQFNSKNDDEIVQYRRDFLVTIIGLMWHIHHKGVKKGDIFERGSYVILDPDQLIYHYLLNYVALSTGYKNPEEDLARPSVPGFGWGNSFAYNRDAKYGHSSHLKRSDLNSVQWGIDMRLSGDGNVHEILPSQATHLLFAKFKLPGVSQNLTYIKFEEIGVGCMQDVALHAYTAMFALNPFASKPKGSRREKDVIPEVFEVFKRFDTKFNKEQSVAENRKRLPEEGKSALAAVTSVYYNDEDAKYRLGSECSLSVADLGTLAN